MKCIYLYLWSIIPLSLVAQQPDAAAELGWKHSLVAGLTLTQISYTNWAQGGENALAWVLNLDGKSVDDEVTTSWSNSYKFAFGQARLGERSLSKTDDKIDLGTALIFKFGVYVNPYAAATLKTQFAKGYKYDAQGKTAVSGFLDPGYMTQSAGVVYQPIPEIKTRFGGALREIFTSQFTRYADDPATASVEKTKIDGGLESVIDVEWKIEDNILLTSRLEMFSAFKNFDAIVIRIDNTLMAKVSKYISVNLNLQLIKEDQVSPRTQVKETLALGLSYTLL